MLARLGGAGAGRTGGWISLSFPPGVMPHADSPTHAPWVLSKQAGDSPSGPSLSPACVLLSFCLPWWPTHPHCSSRKQESSPLYLSSELQPRIAVRCRPEKALRSPQTCLSLGLNLFDAGLCSQCCSAAGSGTCASTSVLISADGRRIGLVIFQARSALGLQAIGES